MDNLSILFSTLHILYGCNDSILIPTLLVIKESLHSLSRELYNMILSNGLINEIKSLLETSTNIEVSELYKSILERLEEFNNFSYSSISK